MGTGREEEAWSGFILASFSRARLERGEGGKVGWSRGPDLNASLMTPAGILHLPSATGGWPSISVIFLKLTHAASQQGMSCVLRDGISCLLPYCSSTSCSLS